MKNEIKIFESPEFGRIRTVTDEKGEPLFCLTDVCKVLGLKQNGVVMRLEKGVISTEPLSTRGGTQIANFVNEDGLYDVILDSRKPSARAFRKWITSEVLPQIRKTGGGCILISEMAKLLTRNGYVTGRTRFFRWLRENGYIFKKSTEPIQKWVEMGIFATSVTMIHTNHGAEERVTTKVTGKGQEYFLSKLRRE